MQERSLVAHDADMAFPEDEIAAAQIHGLAHRQLGADLARLNVGVARRCKSGRGKRYLHDDEFTTPLTSGSTIAAGTYTGSGALHAMNGLVHFGTAAGTTLTSIRESGITINFNVTNLDVPQMSGIDGFAQFQRNTRPPITVELVVPGAHETYADAFQANTKYGLIVQFGAGSTSIRGIALPTLQIAKRPEPTDINGMRGVKLSLEAQENGHSSDKTTEIRRAPYVLFT